MKKELIFTIGLTGVLAFTIGFVAKDFQNTKVSTEKTVVVPKQVFFFIKEK